MIGPPAIEPRIYAPQHVASTLSWNEFICALTFIQSSENKTVPVGVSTELVRGDVFEWRALMAGAQAAQRAAVERHGALCTSPTDRVKAPLTCDLRNVG